MRFSSSASFPQTRIEFLERDVCVCIFFCFCFEQVFGPTRPQVDRSNFRWQVIVAVQLAIVITVVISNGKHVNAYIITLAQLTPTKTVKQKDVNTVGM